MSDTPRTDAEAWTPKKGAFPIVDAEFARELERENTALREAARRVTAVVGWTINVAGCEDTVRIHAGSHRQAAEAVRDLAAALAASEATEQISEDSSEK